MDGRRYHVAVEHVTSDGLGVFFIHTRIDGRRAAESFVTMRRVLGELQSGDLTEALVRARRRVLRELLASTVHSRAVADELMFVAAHGLGLDHDDELARQVAALRPGQIRALIAAEMAPGREVVVVQGQGSAPADVYQAAGITGYRVLE